MINNLEEILISLYETGKYEGDKITPAQQTKIERNRIINKIRHKIFFKTVSSVKIQGEPIDKFTMFFKRVEKLKNKTIAHIC